jgi:FkbH-like protein
MNLLIISDVVLENVKTELLKIHNYSVDYIYSEDLVAYFLDEQNIKQYNFDILLIYTDQVFHKRPSEWQRQLIDLINTTAEQHVGKKIFLNNLFNRSFEAISYNKEICHIYDNLNLYADLLEKTSNLSNIYILDVYKIIYEIGKENVYNYALGQLYQMPYKKKMITSLANEIHALIKFVSAEEKKIIVVDCDNTLWKGIIGEDGYENVKCDKNADGLLYFDFQTFLKAKKEEGFLLAICSKNNEEDVYDFFHKRTAIPLHWNDFIVKKINWREKYKNIEEISVELNIGLNSFIFIDDNPFEIETISGFLPEVTSIQFSNDYTFFENLLSNLLFRKKNITESDRNKTGLYEIEKQRKIAGQNWSDFDSFIQSLEIKINVKINDTTDLTRLAQLTGKTNQFNFNKIEYSEIELQKYIASGNLIFSLKVADKFGDYGTVALILLSIENDKAVMENYLMSCRILGKKIEYQFFNYVIDYLKQNNKELIEIKFRETIKNIPVKEFINNIQYGNIIKSFG